MTIDTGQTSELDEVETEVVVPETVLETSNDADYNSGSNSVQAIWQSIQTKTVSFLATLPDEVTHFFKNNQQPLLTLGWILVTVVGVRLLFAALDAIDDIPLIAPMLELIGLLYVAWFIYRFLIRASDRQELAQTVNRVKTEILGQES